MKGRLSDEKLRAETLQTEVSSLRAQVKSTAVPPDTRLVGSAKRSRDDSERDLEDARAKLAEYAARTSLDDVAGAGACGAARVRQEPRAADGGTTGARLRRGRLPAGFPEPSPSWRLQGLGAGNADDDLRDLERQFDTRALRAPLSWLTEAAPDVVGIQETKVQDPDFPLVRQALGYHTLFSGQKSYNGVALLSREPAADAIATYLPGFDDRSGACWQPR